MLLAQEDARAMVRAIPTEDLYMTIADVGLHDAAELVQLSSPQQFQAFVDLAAWKRDRINLKEVLGWVHAARGEDAQELLAKLHQLDLEVLELVLRSLLVVHDLEENPDVHPAGATLETAEGKYLIEFLVEGVELAVLRQLVQDLIAENPFEATRLFEAARWELPSELEESAYRFRSARLADLGFPELHEAVSVFTYLDPDRLVTLKSASEGLRPPSQRIDFVEAGFKGLAKEEYDQVEQEIRYLVNSALVAEGAEPGDPRAVRRVSELARDYLSLGLEHLTGADPSRAAEVLREHHLKKVFQAGFSLTLRLKFEVERLAKEPLAKLDGTWLLLPEEAEGVRALALKRPLRALKVPGAEPVPFRSRRELAEARALLEGAGSQREVFSTLLGGSAQNAKAVLARFGASISELGPDRLFRAAVAWAVLDGVAEARPVPESRVVELAERCIEGSAHAPKVRASAVERATKALPAGARSMVDRELGRMAQEWGPAYLTEGRVALPVASVLVPFAP